MLTMLVKNVNALSIWNLGKLQNLRIESKAIQRKIKLKKWFREYAITNRGFCLHTWHWRDQAYQEQTDHLQTFFQRMAYK